MPRELVRAIDCVTRRRGPPRRVFILDACASHAESIEMHRRHEKRERAADRRYRKYYRRHSDGDLYDDADEWADVRAQLFDQPLDVPGE